MLKNNRSIKQRGKIVVSIVSVIVNTEGKVLLSLRKDDENKKAHMKWELPGGKVEFGETATETLVREVREEIGLVVEIIGLIDCLWSNIWNINGEKVQALIIPFLCYINSGEISLQDREVVDTCWFSLDEIQRIDSLPGLKEIVYAAAMQYGRNFYGK